MAHRNHWAAQWLPWLDDHLSSDSTAAVAHIQMEKAGRAVVEAATSMVADTSPVVAEGCPVVTESACVVPKASSLVDEARPVVAEALRVVAEASFMATESDSVMDVDLAPAAWALPVVPEDCIADTNAPRLLRLRCHDTFEEEMLESLTPTGPTEPSVETLCQEVFEPTALAQFMTSFRKCQQERAKPRGRRNPY
jgi:hypothetical protein